MRSKVLTEFITLVLIPLIGIVFLNTEPSYVLFYIAIATLTSYLFKALRISFKDKKHFLIIFIYFVTSLAYVGMEILAFLGVFGILYFDSIQNDLKGFGMVALTTIVVQLAKQFSFYSAQVSERSYEITEEMKSIRYLGISALMLWGELILLSVLNDVIPLSTVLEYQSSGGSTVIYKIAAATPLMNYYLTKYLLRNTNIRPVAKI